MRALQWRPLLPRVGPLRARSALHSSCFAVAYGSGRLYLYDRGGSAEGEGGGSGAGSREGAEKSAPARVRSIRGAIRRESSSSRGERLREGDGCVHSERYRPAACATVSDSGAALHALAFDARGHQLATGTADALIVVYEISGGGAPRGGQRARPRAMEAPG